MAPAYTIVGKAKSTKEEPRPSPSYYDQLSGTIEHERVLQFKNTMSHRTALRDRRAQLREEFRIQKEERRRKEEEDGDYTRVESIPIPITETRTKSDNVDLKLSSNVEPEIHKSQAIRSTAFPIFPGPGQYDLEESWLASNKGCSFGLHGPESFGKYHMMSNIPGPGAFEVRAERSNIGYSFNGGADSSVNISELQKRRSYVKKQENSPQLLAQPSYIGKGPSVKFNPPRSKSFIDKGISAGPASYNPTHPVYKQAITMSGRLQAQSNKMIVPGPGEYDVAQSLTFLNSRMGKTISGRWRDAKPKPGKEGPGPTSYDINKFSYKIQGPKIMKHESRSRRPKPQERYDSQLSTRSLSQCKPKPCNGTFGKALRSDIASKTLTPAPNAYQFINMVRKEAEGDSCTFGVKTAKFFNVNNNPGPGAHLSELPSSRSPQFSFGTGPRSKLENKSYTDNYYYPNDLYSGVGISFTQDQKSADFKKSKYPGPGSYNFPKYVGEIPKYLLNTIDLSQHF